MALSRELLKRLNSEDEPLPKRLKLAENAFCAIDLPILRKEDLILQWLCDVSPADERVCESLKFCLQLDYLNVKQDVKESVVNAILQKLHAAKETLCEEILECCGLLVSNSSMQHYFINKPKALGSLLNSLFTYMYQCFKHTFNVATYPLEGIDIMLLKQTNGSMSVAHDVVINITESIAHIYKISAATRDELRMVFVEDILHPLCTIIHYKCTDHTNKLWAAVYKCIQQLLFAKSRFMENVAKEKGSNFFRELFAGLTKNTKTDFQNNIVTYVIVVQAAVGTYKLDTITMDLVFRELINSAGEYKKEVLTSSLKCVTDVAFDFDNKVEDVTLFDYFQNIINDVLSSEDLTAADHKLLTELFYFNPLIIEKRIPHILEKIILQEQTAEYKNLMNAILDACFKMRQEQKLVSRLLMTLKQALISKEGLYSKAEFFPREFKERFVKSVTDITNLQEIEMLKTLIFHLNTDCMEILQTNESCKNIVMMVATIELLVSLLDGICIFEYSGTLTFHRKFVNTLADLGNALSILTEKALHLSHNKKVIRILLCAILSWSEVQNMLKYYIPDAIMCELTFPIIEDHWQQLIQRITNFGKEKCKSNMNKLILHRLRVSLSHEPSIKLSSLIGGLESSWSFILRYNTEIISFLNQKEISKITHLLLADMMSSKDCFNQWIEVLNKDCLQENRIFMISLLSHILVQVGSLLSSGMTKSIISYIDNKALIESEIAETSRMQKILNSIKEEISENKWQNIDSTVSHNIKLHLKVLSYIPLVFLNSQLRMLIFTVLYAISKECRETEKIVLLCNKMFADLLEKTGVDVFQYIDPVLLMDQLPQSKILSKAFDQSLRNVSSYETLKQLVKVSANTRESMYILLTCFENVKTKLNADQKPMFRKAKRKLSRMIIEMLELKVIESSDIKLLTLVLKSAISNKKVTENLKEIAESTLKYIYTDKNILNREAHEIEEELQLAIVILRNRQTFEIPEDVIKGIWSVILKHICTDLLLPLLESTRPREFNGLLKLLQVQTIKHITEANEASLENTIIIWNAIMKIDMAAKRSKFRLAAIDNLCLTVQTVCTSEKCWSMLLKLFQNILGAKHLYLPENIVDMCILISLKALKEVKLSACEHILMICSTLIKIRTSLITDRLPAFLTLYRRTVDLIVHASETTTDKFTEHYFRCRAFDVEKLTSSLVKLKKDMVRLSPYLIADLLQLLSEKTILPCVKASLQNCISQLLSICDHHGISLLSRALPMTMQEVFKVQLDTFNKFYKFSGKI